MDPYSHLSFTPSLYLSFFFFIWFPGLLLVLWHCCFRKQNSRVTISYSCKNNKLDIVAVLLVLKLATVIHVSFPTQLSPQLKSKSWILSVPESTRRFHGHISPWTRPKSRLRWSTTYYEYAVSNRLICEVEPKGNRNTDIDNFLEVLELKSAILVLWERAAGNVASGEADHPIGTVERFDNKSIKGDNIRVPRHGHNAVYLMPKETKIALGNVTLEDNLPGLARAGLVGDQIGTESEPVDLSEVAAAHRGYVWGKFSA